MWIKYLFLFQMLDFRVKKRGFLFFKLDFNYYESKFKVIYGF